MNMSDYGSKELRKEGACKVVQVSIRGKSILYFGDSSISTHGIILEIALRENLNIHQENPSCEGMDYKVLGMGKVVFHPAFKKMVISGDSFLYKMNMRAADVAAIQADYPDWEIILSY